MAQPAFDDLTARARIRDAALRLFTERGIEGATVRDIAREAGVSPGLLRHHFGSKDGLRDACDTYAFEQLMRIKERAVLDGEVANLAFLPTVQPTLLLLYRYLARSMVDGSAAADALYDHMVDEEWIRRYYPGVSDDPHAFAAVLVAMQLGPLMMHRQLSKALGAEILSPEGHIRMTLAIVDLYSHPLISPELAAQAYAAYGRRYPRGEQI